MKRLRIVCVCVLLAALTARCGRDAAAPEEAELPTLDLTHWTDTTELFMEYPPLVAGQAPLFAVHPRDQVLTVVDRLGQTVELGAVPDEVPPHRDHDVDGRVLPARLEQQLHELGGVSGLAVSDRARSRRGRCE